MSESTSDEELVQAVHDTELSFLPEKSREKYIKAYNLFSTWRRSKGENAFSETLMLSYFNELSETRKSSTLWSIYSMLKATIKTKNDIHIEKYSKLLAFIKKKSSGHKPEKSKVFTTTNIEQFLNEAPDSKYLATKVVLIIGISGACRTHELTYLTTKNVEKHSEKLLLVNIPNTKSNIDRNFVIRDEYVKVVIKYQALRPVDTPIDRFFLQYRKGKCVRQPMGSTKIGGLPREIATFLGLQEPEKYTGHCFRRTSATLLANLGADITTLKRHGGRKSSTLAEVYIADTLENTPNTCKDIIGGITLKQSPDPELDPDPDEESEPLVWTHPSSSKDNKIEIHFEPSADSSVSPTFTIESNEIKQCSENLPNNLLPSSSTQVTNTSITVPKKNLTFNITNCSNFTFNF